jgi:post-segregation antitoxin (ccd killing protein)
VPVVGNVTAITAVAAAMANDFLAVNTVEATDLRFGERRMTSSSTRPNCWSVLSVTVCPTSLRPDKVEPLSTFERNVYSMRMSRVNITVPDDVAAQAREAGLNVSRVATIALIEELDRRAKIAALDTYLAELEAELGPIGPEEAAAATAWADRVLSSPRSASRKRRQSA